MKANGTLWTETMEAKVSSLCNLEIHFTTVVGLCLVCPVVEILDWVT